jgi:hypothetical protein
MPIRDDEFAAILQGASKARLLELITEHVLNPDPVCFVGQGALYTDIRTHIADQVRAETEDVLLVGSGSLGYTIAPHKFPKKFHAESDLDFAVVSPALFDAAWGSLLEWGHPIRRIVPKPEVQWFEARRANVFWGWMDPANLKFSAINRPTLLANLQELSTDWFDTFQSLGLRFPGTLVAERKTSARLYRSMDHLIAYQYEGLRQLQLALAERN